ncbi:hypothetical protein QE152_g18111 [Popillia japonica]|uniref:Mutator-like transposase domain-containing protein n=1 Tax=Popillia japonica TaxID=7064 RepID=A0AAW1L0B5_POPJA
MHGIKYTKLVGDGDSSVHKKLLLGKPYGNMVVEKIECHNHLYRNFYSKLREISNKTRSSSKNIAIPVSLRKVILSNIEKLTTFIKMATTYRIKE